MNKKDLESRKDIECLVNTFYKKVLTDEVIGHIFTEIAKIDMDKHMPIMYDFWETTLFQNGMYKGNPIQVHQNLNKKKPLTKTHFDRWISLFNSTIDSLFVGDKAELAKTRALSIATVMQIKIN